MLNRITRRQFLVSTGLAAGAAAVAGSSGALWADAGSLSGHFSAATPGPASILRERRWHEGRLQTRAWARDGLAKLEVVPSLDGAEPAEVHLRRAHEYFPQVYRLEAFQTGGPQEAIRRALSDEVLEELLRELCFAHGPAWNLSG